MATLSELQDALVNADKAGDADAARQLADAIHAMRPVQAEPQKSESYVQGTQVHPKLREFATLAQGPTFGFSDEIMGALAGGAKTLFNGKPLSQNYQEVRDFMRGQQDQNNKDHPILAPVAEAGASMATLGGLPTVFKGAGWIPRLGNASIVGGISGGISGAGNSTEGEAGKIGSDSLKAAMIGAALPLVILPIAKGAGAVVSNISERVSDTAAMRAAKAKIAEAFLRDSTAPGVSSPIGVAAQRMNKLGEEARIVDSGGASVRSLLDTLATLPGQTKQATEAAIRLRQSTRGDRLIGAADEALGASGQRMSSTVEKLIADRSKAAAPIYNKVYSKGVFIDDELKDIIDAAHKLGAGSEAKKVATAKMRAYGLQPDTKWAGIRELDYLKQGLDDVILANTKDDGRLTKVGAAVAGLKTSLVSRLDSETKGLYKEARDAFAGPSAVIDAVTAGRRALTQDDMAIKTATGSMSASELEGFRIGAFEALRAKLGTRGGQTNLGEMWREPAVQEKLKAIFGNERAYREFASSVAAEGRLKGLEQVGRGSQTAARQYAAGDLDSEALKAGASALASVKTGSPMSAIASARQAWNSVALPEPTRDAMGRLLLQQGKTGRAGLLDLQTISDEVAKQRQINTNRAGLLSVISPDIRF